MAMSPRHQVSLGQCHVTPGSKLSAELNAALCAEVKQAVSAAVPGTAFDAKVTVVSKSRLKADLSVNGTTLPQQNFAVMDNQIDLNSIRCFAQSLGEIAKASKR